MPKAKHRKKVVKGSNRPKVKAGVFLEGNTICVRQKLFAKLRSDPDFISLVRVGRVLNALNFARDVLNLEIDDKNSRHVSRGIRSYFMLAAYLYEGLLVVESLKPLYAGKDLFGRFEEILGDKWSEAREIVRRIRNSAAFHLDWHDRVTSNILAQYAIDDSIRLMTVSHNMDEMTFPLVDNIDFINIVIEAGGSIEEEESFGSLELFGQYHSEFMAGCGDFLAHLSVRLDLLPASVLGKRTGKIEHEALQTRHEAAQVAHEAGKV